VAAVAVAPRGDLPTGRQLIYQPEGAAGAAANTRPVSVFSDREAQRDARLEAAPNLGRASAVKSPAG